jgi:hypothetical protein
VPPLPPFVGREAGKAKPLKAPKGKAKEYDEDDKAFLQVLARCLQPRTPIPSCYTTIQSGSRKEALTKGKKK